MKTKCKQKNLISSVKFKDIIMVIILYNSSSTAIIFISLTFHENSKKQEKEAGFSINLT